MKKILLTIIACLFAVNAQAAYTRTWNPAYEAIPADTDNLSEADDRMRNIKVDVRERIANDHYMDTGGTDADHGEHLQSTYRVDAFTCVGEADKGVTYTKNVNGKAELHYCDEDTNETQITNAGAINVSTFAAGTKMVFYQDSCPTGWTIDNSAADMVLAVKGGATYTTGGATAGSWTVSGLTNDGHTHTGPNHTHTGPSHTHTGPSHVHTMGTHTHTGPSHTHTVANHTHSYTAVIAHTHSVSSSGAHTHSVPGSDAEGSGVGYAEQTSTPGTSISISSSGAHTHTTASTGSASGTTAAGGPSNTGAGGTGNTGSTDPGDTNAGGTGVTGSSGTGATGAGGTGATGSTADTISSDGTWRVAAGVVIICTKD